MKGSHGAASLENRWAVSCKVKHRRAHRPAVPRLGTCPGEWRPGFTRLHMAAHSTLFLTAKLETIPSSTGVWINTSIVPWNTAQDKRSDPSPCIPSGESRRQRLSEEASLQPCPAGLTCRHPQKDTLPPWKHVPVSPGQAQGQCDRKGMVTILRPYPCPNAQTCHQKKKRQFDQVFILNIKYFLERTTQRRGLVKRM